MDAKIRRSNSGASPALGRPHAYTEGGHRRCSSGQCAMCLDNARWERIYKEKFEDPDYYHRRDVVLSPGSALGRTEK
jgi:hypothetical protein